MKKIFLRTLRILGLLEHLNFTMSIKRHGTSFNIPVLGATGSEFFFEDKEAWMLTVLKVMNELTGGRGVFIDVGANIGQTLLKVKCLNNCNWEYVGFEPNPNCLQYLHNVVAANRFKNVQFAPFGLSDETKLGKLFLFSKNPVDSSASVVAGFRSGINVSLAVPLINGYEVLEFFQNKVAVIKIDVEGGELEVLKGLYPMIQKDYPFIICEVLPVYHVSNQLRLSRQMEFERILGDLNYEKFRIDADCRLFYCKEIGIHDSIQDVNYLFCPPGVHQRITERFDVYVENGE